MDTLEEYEIYKHFKNNNPEEIIINEKLKFNSHSIFNSLIYKKKPYNPPHPLQTDKDDKPPGQGKLDQSVPCPRRDHVFVDKPV